MYTIIIHLCRAVIRVCLMLLREVTCLLFLQPVLLDVIEDKRVFHCLNLGRPVRSQHLRNAEEWSSSLKSTI